MQHKVWLTLAGIIPSAAILAAVYSIVNYFFIGASIL